MTAQAADGIRLGHGVSTHAGHRREENQDAFLARPPIYLVADGMGGHASGREAALLVSDAFDSVIAGAWVTPADLLTATAAAAAAVEGLSEETSGRPGSTVTGVAVTYHDARPAWLVFNIGDSRTYLLRAGDLEQVTVDHSRLQELVDTGVTDADARRQVSSNLITRAIGGGSKHPPTLDQWLLPAATGDRVLVCSDGVPEELSDSLIAATLLAFPDPAEAAAALVQAALDAGGHDNLTAVVVDAVDVPGTSHAARDWEVDTLSDGQLLEAEDTSPDSPPGFDERPVERTPGEHA